MQIDITEILQRVVADEESDHATTEALYEVAYEELRRIAKQRLSASGESTLRPTELVHEAFIRVVKGQPVDWKGRAHFLRHAATAMRHVLVDRARKRGAVRRGGDLQRVSITTLPSDDSPIVDFLVVEDAFQDLAGQGKRVAHVAEMKIFAGTTNAEVAVALGVSESTVKTDWRLAQTFLAKRILARPGDGQSPPTKQ